MNKIKTLMVMMIAAITMGSLTSCEDGMIANTLEGTWQGNMYAEYQWQGEYYETDYTEVTFLKDPNRYASGEGYWVDYFKTYTPWSGNKIKYYANRMTWKVENRDIVIYLIDDDTVMRIRDYDLNDNRFYGEVYATDGSWRQFSLRHISSPNWNQYDWGYNRYYAPSADGKAPAQSAERPVRIIK